MQVEQIVDVVVDRTQLARARQLDARTRAIEHLGRPEPVEVLVDAARREGIGGVEPVVCGNVGEDQRQDATERAQSFAQESIERNRTANFVAMRERLYEDMGAR